MANPLMTLHPHVYVCIHVSSEKIRLHLEIFEYTEKEMNCIAKGCEWRRDAHAPDMSKLWKSGTDIRCLSCVPWGNAKISKGFQRIGCMISEVS